MNEDKGVMKYETVLPSDFNGVFPFTNWSSEDFIGVWNSVAYKFLAMTTSPMIMPFSPLEIQHIRKKFAKDLAEREFFKSNQYEKMRAVEGTKDDVSIVPRLNSIHQASTYTIGDLESYIKKALEPMEAGKVEAHQIPKMDIEDKLSRNDGGELNTTAIDSKTSLRTKALSS